MKDFLKAVLSWAAGYYRERLSEKVKQGLPRKKAQAARQGEAYLYGRRALAFRLCERVPAPTVSRPLAELVDWRFRYRETKARYSYTR
jgi:DNA invertase Pin-like site-specific DNA recombinase